MKRPIFLLTFLALCLPLAGAERPNILMLAVDDLRPELGCYGVERVLSPHIDELAASGTLFERAYVQQSVCGPSRISILTGLRPDRTGILSNPLSLSETAPEVISLPRRLREAGYVTLSLGKSYHEPGDDALAWTEQEWRPFGIPDGWRNYRLPENRARVRELLASYPEQRRERTPLGRVKGPAYEAADVPDNVYPDGLTADMAVHTLDRLAREEAPYFLAVGFYKPHLPFACPQAYWDLYEAESIQLAEQDTPPEGMPELAFVDSIELRSYDGIPQEGPVDEELARTLIHGYLACVSYMDAQIGRVLDALEELGLAENTIVVLWGDHGWHLEEAGIWGKMTNFELGTRVPLILRAPGVTQGGERTRSLAEMVDLYPTLCELTGVKPPKGLDGQSLVPLLSDPDATVRDSALSMFPRPRFQPHEAMGYALRTDRYRYVKWVGFEDFTTVKGVELYDHEVDPGETRNLALDPEKKGIVEALDQKLKQRLELR